MTTLYEFSASTLSGREQSLSEYRGKLVLVVNTASKCGFTPQFAGLEKLYSTHSADGLEVLGFPCDQFAGQEFDDAAQIAEFCSLNYGVTFPMFAKVEVNGDDAHSSRGSARRPPGRWAMPSNGTSPSSSSTERVTSCAATRRRSSRRRSKPTSWLSCDPLRG